MKKCLLFIFVFGITFSLWNIKAFAYDSNFPRIYVKYSADPQDDRYYCFGNYDTSDIVYLTYTKNNNGTINITSNVRLSDCVMLPYNTRGTITEWEAWFAEQGSFGTTGTANLNILQPPIVGVNVIINPATSDDTSDQVFDSIEDYEDSLNPPEPDPTWWENVSSWMEDYFNNIIELGRIPVDFWEWIWGDPDIDDQPELIIVDPPSPTALPTSIPYSTTINPSTGEIEYHYEISGTPINSTLPPPEPTYQITLPPDAGIAMPSGIYFSDEGLQDVIDAIDDNMEDYTGSIETIRDSFSTIPVKWFAFFGIPAAIMIIAGVIKSLLG